jgi:hypothetical protein
MKSLIMALGLTQPLKEVGAIRYFWDKARPERKADNLSAINEPIFYTLWRPRIFTTPQTFTVCYRDSFTYYIHKMFALHRKHTYGPPRPVTGIAFLSYV